MRTAFNIHPVVATAVAAACLGACQAYPTASAHEGPTLVLQPGWGRSVLVESGAYTRAQVVHLTLALYELAGATEALQDTLDVLNAQLDAPVTFSHLKARTTYRVRALAYKAVDSAPENLISTSDAQSYVDVTVGADDRPTFTTMKVKLVDVARAVVSTLAGGAVGTADGPAILAQFAYPRGVAADAAGNVYVVDGNNRIRKVSPAGGVTTLAGATAYGYADGQGATARFNDPQGLAVDASGNVFVADSLNHRIRKITPDGTVSTLAGSTAGFADGLGDAAQFSVPAGIAVDAPGNVYVADGNHRIRKVTPAGVVTTLAGSGSGYADGQGAAAKFDFPTGLTVDPSGNVFVVDYNNQRIRKVTPAGIVTTVAGNGSAGYADGPALTAQFCYPHRIALDGGYLYVADAGNHRIRRISPTGQVSTLAGGSAGAADGRVTTAQFNFPFDIAADAGGNLYVADLYNNRIRKVQ